MKKKYNRIQHKITSSEFFQGFFCERGDELRKRAKAKVKSKRIKAKVKRAIPNLKP